MAALASSSKAMQVWLDIPILRQGDEEHDEETMLPDSIVSSSDTEQPDVLLFRVLPKENSELSNRQQRQLVETLVQSKTSTTCLIEHDNRLYSYQDLSSSSSSPLASQPTQKNCVGIVVTLDSNNNKGQEQAMAAMGSVEWVLVRTTITSSNDANDDNDWQMIPAEKLIGAAVSSGTKIAFCVDKVSDVGGLSRALELGVDALCVIDSKISATKEDEYNQLWNAVLEARKERNAQAAKQQNMNDNNEKVAVAPRVITGSCWRRLTKSTILADRICVDLVQSLLPEEGCWVGSSAKIMALVLSEAAASQYVPTRPFRVNAGPVHSYILLADNSTKYLSELQAADQIAVYNAKTGQTRSVAVGRLKEEVRPCVLVELQLSSSSGVIIQSGQIFLQQAETVRLGQENGSFVRVTDLEAQTEDPTIQEKESSKMESILLRVMTTGTHIGNPYTGKVEER